jgi:cytochrome c oxidase cbb3-type subunit 3
VAVLSLVGCDEADNVAGGAEPGRPDVVGEVVPPPGTFEPNVLDVQAPVDDRAPADADRTILVPATNLFPGTARIDPQIDNPMRGEAEAIAAGERHFNAFNCSGCHAPLGGGGMGPPLSDYEWIYGDAPAQIFLTIMHGRPQGMPAFGSMLPEQTVWELDAYIETLSNIDDYAAEIGFEENVGGFRNTQDAESDADAGGSNGKAGAR